MATGELEILIPNWNGRDRLRRAIRSLLAQTEAVEVCVVDNGSADGSVEMVRDEFPGVRLVGLDRNLGFGPALNRGVAGSTARLIGFLNNDAVADAGFARHLLSVAYETGAEMIAACLVDPDGFVESAGVIVDRSLTTFDLLNGVLYDPDDPSLASAAPMAPSGGACAFSREAFAAVGGFDEAIFAYLEDVDLGIRMRMAGSACALAPRAFVVHQHSATLGRRSPEKNRLLAWSRRHLIWKYGAGLTRGERIAGLASDLVVTAGKAAVDRNLGAVRGWVQSSRAHRGVLAPPLPSGFADVPRADMPLGAGLRRRLARRRISSPP